MSGSVFLITHVLYDRWAAWVASLALFTVAYAVWWAHPLSRRRDRATRM